LDALLDKLRAAGVDVDPRRDEAGFGRFAWVNDPEGNRVGLWETPKTPPA
jgi:predicted enzyme related to lactoylglutathione lyase